MIGAIIGDVIGSVFEWHNTKTTDFELFSRESRFTDDTVMTVAIADSLLNRKNYRNPIKDEIDSRKVYSGRLRQYGHRYPNAGYGTMFNNWLANNSQGPYRSYGNGSAMRVSPIGFAANSIEEVLKESKRSAKITHNHREGIKGAQAVAVAVFLARSGERKENIKNSIERMFKYNLDRKLNNIRATYKFDSSCQGSVPEAIIAFLESENFEDAIRKAISLGGDSDTIACITGGIAQAFYKKIPAEIINDTMFRSDIGLKTVIKEFNKKYKVEY